MLLADAAALTPDLDRGADLERAAADRRPAAARRRRGAPHRRALRHALPHHRQLLHDLRREPDPDLGDPRLARHPGRGGAAHLLRERPARGLRPAGRLRCRGSASPSPASSGRAALLAPSFLQSDIYGFGFKLPYYRVLGPSADVTLTPFVTTGGARADRGRVPAALRQRRLRPLGRVRARRRPRRRRRPGRGAFTAVGALRAAADFVADFDLSAASDDSFLHPVRLFRRRPADQRRPHPAHPRRTTISSSAPSPSRACAEDEDDQRRALRPARVHLPPADRRRRGSAAGSASTSTRSASCARPAATCSAPAARSDWRRDWTLPHGVLRLGDRRGAASTSTRSGTTPTSPTASRCRRPRPPSVELRWPLVRHTGAGRPRDRADRPGRLRPTRSRDQDDIPNEDSQLPEFDETNLFSLNRFPGLDRLETGLRANLGVSYTRYDPAGWSLGVTLGRVLRAEPSRRVRRGHRPRRAAGRTTSARSRSTSAGGSTCVNRALFDTEPRLPPQRVRAGLRRRPRRAARGLRLSRRGRHQPDPRAAARDQRARARRPLPGAPELGAARALALRRRRPAATCAPAPASPTATSAPSSTFRSRAAIPHRIMCRPRPRSASACGSRASATTGERNWPARVCMARGT